MAANWWTACPRRALGHSRKPGAKTRTGRVVATWQIRGPSAPQTARTCTMFGLIRLRCSCTCCCPSPFPSTGLTDPHERRSRPAWCSRVHFRPKLSLTPHFCHHRTAQSTPCRTFVMRQLCYSMSMRHNFPTKLAHQVLPVPSLPALGACALWLQRHGWFLYSRLYLSRSIACVTRRALLLGVALSAASRAAAAACLFNGRLGLSMFTAPTTGASLLRASADAGWRGDRVGQGETW